MSSVADDQDVISSLPDTVLCHILSFIPTTDAVATSVLSKRWTHLWRSVPSLNICDVYFDDLEDYCRFSEFVYSVLLARNNTSIKSSILNIWYNDPHLGRLGFPNVIKWINSLVQHGLERLEMCVGMNVDDFQLPISILSCRTLVVLDVSGFTVNGFSSVKLPSLKILHFHDNTFLKARDLLLLLTGCPILEDLYAQNLCSQSDDSLSYQECESLSLSKLVKAKMPHTFFHFPLKALRNVNELYIELNKVYRCFDEIPTFHNLTKLKLHSINYNWNLLVQVLNRCPNLQHLQLSQGTDYGGGRRDNDQENWVDPISVPQCISLHLKTCTLWYFRGQQGNSSFITPQMSSVADDQDVISSLPDTVLCHILSFIPTTDAVATSVLSKRWTHLWRSVPSLNICDVYLDDLEDYHRFNEFVYSVLLARNNTSIKSSILNIWYDDSHIGRLGFPNVIKWINSLVQHGLERLEMSVNMVGDDLQLPISILSCRTLVVLDFFGLSVNGFSSVRLPSLKTLHFDEAVFLNARDLLLLLAGCPILEDLYASSLRFQSEDSLSYQECQSLSLNKLTKAKMPLTFCHFPLKALRNVNELYIEINKVYRSLDEIPTFHNLTKLKLHSINYNWNLLVQVLNHCPNLQHLQLSQGTEYGGGRRDNDQENWVDPISVPQCISLHLKTCTLWYFRGQQGELQLAKYILNHARVLQTMKICCRDSLKKERELSLCSKVSPTCELTFDVFRFHTEESLSD